MLEKVKDWQDRLSLTRSKLQSERGAYRELGGNTLAYTSISFSCGHVRRHPTALGLDMF